MRRLTLLGLLLLAAAGCVAGRPWNPMAPPVPIYCDNPTLIPVADPVYVWETVVAIVGTYFKIKSEEPVRIVGGTPIEGRLDSYPEVGSTVLEPWRHDSADAYERLESTLQSIRREAHVRVVPAQGGFLVDVAVFKSLEDVTRPAHASAGAATFQPESSVTRVVSPVGEQEVNKNWIALGRDQALEQRILRELQDRLGIVGQTPTAPINPVEQPAFVPSQPGVSPSQPSAPSTSPQCRLGARSASDGPQQRTAYRFQLTEEDFQPGNGQFALSDAMPRRLPPVAPEGIPVAYEIGLESDAAGCSPPVLADMEPSCDVLSSEISESQVDLSELPQRRGWWRGRMRPELGHLLGDVLEDYQRFYSFRGLLAVGAGVGTAAVLANTSIDSHFQNWHDEHVFSHTTSRIAYVVREFGDGFYWVPFFGLCAALRPEFDPGSPAWFVGEWGNRSLRTFLVAGPAVGVLQSLLGGARPENHSPDLSHWTPFHNDHGVSGHAFIGGIVFLNVAMMTDDMPLKITFMLASAMPAWARVIQDKHYLSQAILGWSLAYLGAAAVDRTDRTVSNWMISPVVMDDGIGIGILGSW